MNMHLYEVGDFYFFAYVLTQAVILTHIDANTGGVDLQPKLERRSIDQFALFYRSALHWLEFDKRQEVRTNNPHSALIYSCIFPAC